MKAAADRFFGERFVRYCMGDIIRIIYQLVYSHHVLVSRERYMSQCQLILDHHLYTRNQDIQTDLTATPPTKLSQLHNSPPASLSLAKHQQARTGKLE